MHGASPQGTRPSRAFFSRALAARRAPTATAPVPGFLAARDRGERRLDVDGVRAHRKPERPEEPLLPDDGLLRRDPEPPGEPRLRGDAEADRLAVGEARVAGHRLERVADGVAVVEDVADRKSV